MLWLNVCRVCCSSNLHEAWPSIQTFWFGCRIVSTVEHICTSFRVLVEHGCSNVTCASNSKKQQLNGYIDIALISKYV